MMDVEVMSVAMAFHKIGKLKLMKMSSRKGVNICMRMYILQDVLANTIISSFAQLPTGSLFKLVALFY